MSDDPRRTGLCFGLPALVLGCLTWPGAVQAFDYTPTPLAKALAAHDLVLLAKVKDRAGDLVDVEPSSVIKGKYPTGPISLPHTWRPGTEFTFGPVPLEVGKTYLLMLHGKPDGGYALSKDFAAPAVKPIQSEKDALLRTVIILHDLSQQEKPEGRKDVLSRVWEKEAEETKKLVLDEFWQNPADPATVPFLLQALNAGPDQPSLPAASGEVLLKHRYREAIPDLLKILKKKAPISLYAARALATMKVAETYELILALIEEPTLGNREYFIETLAQLEDRRAIPFFIKLLPRNLRPLDPAYGTYRSWSFKENEFAVEGLGRLRAAEAVEPLLKLLTLEGPGYQDFRTRVVQALGSIGPPARQAIPRIREQMQAEQVEKSVATEALKKIER